MPESGTGVLMWIGPQLHSILEGSRAGSHSCCLKGSPYPLCWPAGTPCNDPRTHFRWQRDGICSQGTRQLRPGSIPTASGCVPYSTYMPVRIMASIQKRDQGLTRAIGAMWG